MFLGYGVGVIFDSVVKPYLYKEIVDSFTSGNPPEVILHQVTHFAVIICFVIVLYIVAFRTGDYATTYFESNVMKELHDTTFNRLLAHSYNFFSNNFSGSIVAKAKRFSRSFETFTDTVSFQIWFSGVSMAGILTVLFIEAPIIAIVFLVWSLVYIGITFLFIRKKIIMDMEEASADSSVTGQLSDAILNILNIKIFGSSKREQKLFEEATHAQEQKRRRAWYFGNKQNIVQGALMAILQMILLFFEYPLVVQGSYFRGHDRVGAGVYIRSF